MERTSSLTRNAGVLVTAFFLLLVGVFIVSQSNKFSYLPEGQIPEPGLTPRSPFYVTDIVTENALLFLAFDDKYRSYLALRFANEKLAEIIYLNERRSGFYSGEVATERAIQKAQEYRNFYLNISKDLSMEKPQTKSIKMSDFMQASAMGSINSFFTEPLPPPQYALGKIYNAMPAVIQDWLMWLGESLKAGYLWTKEWSIAAAKNTRDYVKSQILERVGEFIDKMLGR